MRAIPLAISTEIALELAAPMSSMLATVVEPSTEAAAAVLATLARATPALCDQAVLPHRAGIGSWSVFPAPVAKKAVLPEPPVFDSASAPPVPFLIRRAPLEAAARATLAALVATAAVAAACRRHLA